MKVFVTGASGFIGSAVTRELIRAGHHVVGVARSDESAAKLIALGAEAHAGSLDDLESLKSGAANADGVIHIAFNNLGLATDFAAASAQDRQAITVIGETLKGTDKPLVVTAGTAGIKPGQVLTENDAASPESPRGSETAAMEFATQGVRVSVMRLPFSVHSGEADKHGFIPSIINFAREKGVSAYIGDGANRWPAVHVLDAAHLFRLALEAAPAGSLLNAVGDEGIPFKDIAEIIGLHLDLKTVSIELDAASEHFAWLARFASMDSPASSTLTKEQMGWEIKHLGLVADLEAGEYFTR